MLLLGQGIDAVLLLCQVPFLSKTTKDNQKEKDGVVFGRYAVLLFESAFPTPWKTNPFAS